MPPVAVVKKPKCPAEILYTLEVARWEVAVKRAQPILERLEPALDVVALSAAHHDVLQSKPPRRPSVPGTTIGDDNWLPLAVAKAALEESQRIDALLILCRQQIYDLAIFGVYGPKNVNPAAFRADLGLADDEAAPPLTFD